MESSLAALVCRTWRCLEGTLQRPVAPAKLRAPRGSSENADFAGPVPGSHVVQRQGASPHCPVQHRHPNSTTRPEGGEGPRGCTPLTVGLTCDTVECQCRHVTTVGAHVTIRPAVDPATGTSLDSVRAERELQESVRGLRGPGARLGASGREPGPGPGARLPTETRTVLIRTRDQDAISFKTQNIMSNQIYP